MWCLSNINNQEYFANLWHCQMWWWWQRCWRLRPASSIACPPFHPRQLALWSSSICSCCSCRGKIVVEPAFASQRHHVPVPEDHILITSLQGTDMVTLRHMICSCCFFCARVALATVLTLWHWFEWKLHQSMTRVSISREVSREMTHLFLSWSGEPNFHFSFSSRFSRIWKPNSPSILKFQDF